MKFWVKAIVDDDIQEQLFVDANNLAELYSELEQLLQLSVATISISDFQGQVVDKLNSGADIITVKLRRHGSKFSDGSDTNNAGRILLEPRTAPPVVSKPRLSGSAEMEDVDRINSSLSSAQHPNSRYLQATPELETLSMHSISPSKSQFLDVPQLDRIWLSRDNVVLLLNPLFRNKYISVINGCFVRIREDKGYTIFQVMGVEDEYPHRLELDALYTTEKRELSTVSNAPPATAEVNAWIKRLLNSLRSFPTLGFIEAKRGDVDSALSAARSALDTATPPPQTSPLVTAPLPPSPNVCEEFGSTARRGTVLSQMAQTHIPTGRIVIKTNDHVRYVHIQAAANGENANCDRLAVYGTRRANRESKKKRRSDYAGFVWKLENNAKGSTTLCCDRDVTEKGYDLLCCPVWWGDRYIALGRTQPIAANAGPRLLESTGALVQDFALLSGDTPDALYAEPEAMPLPIPKWAQQDGLEPKLLAPQLVLHVGRLHAFYLVRTLAEGLALTVPSKQSSFCRVGQRSSREMNTALSSGRATPLGVCIEQTQTFHPNASASSMQLPVDRGTLTTSAPNCNPVREKFSLCHAVTCTEDHSFANWQCHSDKDAILHAVDVEPLFSVLSTTTESLAGFDLNSGNNLVPPGSDGCFPNALNLLWHAEFSAPTLPSVVPPARRRSPASLTLQLTESPSGRVPIPFQRWVNHDPHTRPVNWTHDVYYAAVQLHPERLRESVDSLSLFEKDDFLFLSTVTAEHGRATLWTVPIVEDP